MGCAPSSPLPEGGATAPSTPRRSSGGTASAASASASVKSLPPPEALRDLEYATLVLLSSPELRAPLEAYLASSPNHAGAAAGVAFVAALERAQGDLEQGITAPRAVENAAAPGPFELGLWTLARQALDKFRGFHQPAALELRSVERAVFSAQNEVRLMGHAYTLGPPPAAPGEALQWVRACPIEPQEAFVHIRQARTTAARLLAAYALPHFARSPWGLAQSTALRQSGYAEPRAPLSSAPPAHCPGDRVADILDALAGVAVRRASAASPSALGEDDFEAAAALRRAAWLEQFKALVDSIPVCVSVGDMRKFGAWGQPPQQPGARARRGACRAAPASQRAPHPHSPPSSLEQARPLSTSTPPFASSRATPWRRWPRRAGTPSLCRAQGRRWARPSSWQTAWPTPGRGTARSPTTRRTARPS